MNIPNSVRVNTIFTEDVTAVEVAAELFSDDVNPLYVKSTGTAKVCEPDKPDAEIGLKLALGRALKDMGRQLISDAYSEVHENDRERVRREEATKKSLETRKAAELKFQQEFAELIVAENPGIFDEPKIKVSSSLNGSFKLTPESYDTLRRNLPG